MNDFLSLYWESLISCNLLFQVSNLLSASLSVEFRVRRREEESDVQFLLVLLQRRIASVVKS